MVDEILKYRSGNLIILYHCIYSGLLDTIELLFEIDQECRI